MTAEAEVRAAFAEVRELCDPRGHDVLDALELLCVNNLSRLDLLVGNNHLHSVRADRLDHVGASSVVPGGLRELGSAVNDPAKRASA